MKAHELNDAIGGLNNLDDKQKSSILKIIDLKMEDDMQKVLDKIDTQSNKTDTQFSEVRSQFGRQLNKLASQFGGLESKFGGLDHKIDTLQKLIWGVLIGLAFTVISFILKK